MRHNLPVAATDITLDYAVEPSMVVGGVWVDEKQDFVQVALSGESFSDQDFGYTIYEYAELDASGEPKLGDNDQPIIRANLMLVPPNTESPVWKINNNAGGGTYYERQNAVEGSGQFFRWEWRDGAQPPLRQRHELPSNHNYIVRPGNAFSVRASHLGASVLAVFSGAPFDLGYEERIKVPKN